MWSERKQAKKTQVIASLLLSFSHLVASARAGDVSSWSPTVVAAWSRRASSMAACEKDWKEKVLPPLSDLFVGGAGQHEPPLLFPTSRPLNGIDRRRRMIY